MPDIVVSWKEILNQAISGSIVASAIIEGLATFIFFFFLQGMNTCEIIGNKEHEYR
jgi:hypothetical protein